MLVLDDGEVAQQGVPEEVAARPLTEHVARLVGLNVLRDGDRLTGVPPVGGRGLAPPAGRLRAAALGAARSPGSRATVTPYASRSPPTHGPRLIADVTPEAAVELGLAPGRRVWLAVKATAVEDYAATPL